VRRTDATLPLVDSGDLGRDTNTAPWLFLLVQRDRPLAPSARYRLADIEAVTLGRGATRGRSEGPAGHHEISIDDPWMSTAHARLVREGRGFVLEDLGSRNGTLRNGTPTTRASLDDGDVIELGRTFFLYRDAIAGAAGDVDESALTPLAHGMLTLSPSFAGELERLSRIARTTISIIVIGETGTGKEVLSRTLHALSGRSGPFVAVNCAALPDGLVQSELFGHKKGAFSGAVEDRPGLVRSADAGTLLLDELGDLGPTGQGALLRVLQEGEVLPVGGSRPVSVDVRVVSATHRDLESLTAAGTFRSDLLARLSGFVFRVPALRQRREDLGILLRGFLRTLAPDPAAITLSQEATRALLAYPWPSNIRELEKCVAAAMAQALDGAIQGHHLPDAVRAAARVPKVARATPNPTSGLHAERRSQIIALLHEHAGNVSAVARAMGTARAQIHRWLRKFELDPAEYRR
jgi:transcriptional regulator with GAF, ATPase, and Fis domain